MDVTAGVLPQNQLPPIDQPQETVQPAQQELLPQAAASQQPVDVAPTEPVTPPPPQSAPHEGGSVDQRNGAIHEPPAESFRVTQTGDGGGAVPGWTPPPASPAHPVFDHQTGPLGHDWELSPGKPLDPQQSGAGYGPSHYPPARGGRHRGLQPGEPSPSLYVHNVPRDASDEELRDLFSTFGHVDRIRVKVNQKIGPQALYAFVTFRTTDEAKLALERLNGYDMRSRKLRIEFQRSRTGGRSPSPVAPRGGPAMPYAAVPGSQRMRYLDAAAPSSYSSHGGGAQGAQQQYSGATHFAASDGPTFGDRGSGGRHLDHRSGRRPSRRSGSYSNSGGDGGGYSGGASPYSTTAGSERRHDGSLRSMGGAGGSYDHEAGAAGGPNGGAYGAVGKDWGPRRNQPLAAPPIADAGGKRVTILLCDLLRTVKPHLFATQPPAAGPPPFTVPGATTAAAVTPTPAGAAAQPPAAPLYAQQPAAAPQFSGPSGHQPLLPPHTQQLQPPFAEPPEAAGPPAGSADGATAVPAGRSDGPQAQFVIVYRSMKRRSPVELVPVTTGVVWEDFIQKNSGGGVAAEAPPVLNISHRSSWEDVSKKSVAAVCYFRAALADMPGVPGAVVSPRDVFAEHISYLVGKERAGVATLDSRAQVYLLPPGFPLFDEYRARYPQIPSAEVMIGLVVLPTAAAAATAPPGANLPGGGGQLQAA